MCGILAIFESSLSAKELRSLGLRLVRTIRHRGPDWSGLYVYESPVRALIAHERLAIVDVVSGAQPIISTDGRFVLAVNGEIYNHEKLRASMDKETQDRFVSKSDCEVILHMVSSAPDDLAIANVLNRLRGMFGFVLLDTQTGRYWAARDPIGIIPLYIGWANDGSVHFASEMKALEGTCKQLRQFPPGYYYDSAASGDQLKPYFDVMTRWTEPTTPLDLTVLRESLIDSVRSHMMADVPYGVLLSGGLDSSLIASIAARVMSEDPSLASFGKLRSFSVGLKGSPDLAAAKDVAEFIGTAHTALEFTIEQALDALSDVIYHIETYDVTTIRSSTPMYLMARLIKASGVKMVLSGEGADEIFGGYLYFHKAPGPVEFHEETLRKLAALFEFDCLRANKAMSSFGVEARVPFLDVPFLDTAMTLDPIAKMPAGVRAEKYCLRSAFDTPDRPFLPKHVLWRQKEQFSDGVGYSWIDSLREYAEDHVSERMMETASFRFPHGTPSTKEAYMYREIFERHFPSAAAAATVPSGPSVACSSPAAIAWDKSFQDMQDPSGRAVKGVHKEAY